MDRGCCLSSRLSPTSSTAQAWCCRGFRVIDVQLDPIPTHRRCCLEAIAQEGDQDAANLNRADMVSSALVISWELLPARLWHTLKERCQS